jgi:IS30 family transposase
MAQHRQFTIDSEIQVYFSVHTDEDFEAIAEELNNRPRQTLNWLTPLETRPVVIHRAGDFAAI